MSATQRLRDLFLDRSIGLTTGDELDKELSRIERYFGLAVTTPNPWGTMPAARIAVLEAEEAALVAAETAAERRRK